MRQETKRSASRRGSPRQSKADRIAKPLMLLYSPRLNWDFRVPMREIFCFELELWSRHEL
jgi:hypothetical protein